LREKFGEAGHFAFVHPTGLATTTNAVFISSWMLGGEGLPPHPNNFQFFTSCNITGMSWERFEGDAPPPPPPPPPSAPALVRTGGFGLWIQSGANASQGMHVHIESMSAQSLGLRDINLNITIDVRQNDGINISPLIDIADNALVYVNRERANLGAKQNRLEHAARSLLISNENLQDSESRIRNADIAREMMTKTMQTILQQSGIAMLSQARQLTDMVLQLIR
jgi:hypothetical protein